MAVAVHGMVVVVHGMVVMVVHGMVLAVVVSARDLLNRRPIYPSLLQSFDRVVMGDGGMVVVVHGMVETAGICREEAGLGFGNLSRPMT